MGRSILDFRQFKNLMVFAFLFGRMLTNLWSADFDFSAEAQVDRVIVLSQGGLADRKSDLAPYLFHTVEMLNERGQGAELTFLKDPAERDLVLKSLTFANYAKLLCIQVAKFILKILVQEGKVSRNSLDDPKVGDYFEEIFRVDRHIDDMLKLGVIIFPIVSQTGILNEFLMNKAIAHKIALVGIPMELSEYDGRRLQLPTEFVAHDLVHSVFTKTLLIQRNITIGKNALDILNVYAIHRQLYLKLLSESPHYSIYQYMLFHLTHERSYGTLKYYERFLSNDKNYFKTDLGLSADTFLRSCQYLKIYLQKNVYEAIEIMLGISCYAEEDDLMKRLTFIPPELKDVRVRRDDIPPKRLIHNTPYGKILDLQNALRGFGLEFEIWDEQGLYRAEWMKTYLWGLVDEFRDHMLKLLGF